MVDIFDGYSKKEEEKDCDTCRYEELYFEYMPCHECMESTMQGPPRHWEPKCGDNPKEVCESLEPIKEGFVVKNKNGSMKADGGKTRFELLPWDLIEEIAQVMTKGAEKYSPYNWQGLPRSRLIGASFRHIVASIMGEELDHEWNLPHLAHAICELLYLRWMEKNGVDNPDD